MKAILICPSERKTVERLADAVPLSNLTLCGKTVIEYWIEHLAARGARDIYVLAADRPETVRAHVNDGKRWGVRVAVIPEVHEITREEAAHKYSVGTEGWLPGELAITTMDYLPGYSVLPLFDSYVGFVGALAELMPRTASEERIGLHEIKPGVWAGMHTHISPGAQLVAPCWIGDDVEIGEGAVVGPMTVVEHGSVIEGGTEVAHSAVGPDTFVGRDANIQDSIACGSTLVSWRLNSAIRVADEFLMASLDEIADRRGEILGRILGAFGLLLTLPMALFPILRSQFRGMPVFKARTGLRPRVSEADGLLDETFVYYELTGTRSWLKRWPQLLSIVLGDLSWIGNRPLTRKEAAMLTNEFESLWLASRPGLLSLGDVEQTTGVRNEMARVAASYYSVRKDRKLDCSIFARALFLFAFGTSLSRAKEWVGNMGAIIYGKERKASFTWKFNSKIKL